MEAVSGVFQSRADAEKAVNELRRIGVENNKIGLVTPDNDGEEIERGFPVTDTERPGMGRAMGAAVGGAMGAAGGATLGLAAATLMVPGVGPVIAFGMVGAALLGIVGATAGQAVGNALEDELGDGVPHEDVYLYEDALRHGRSIVVAYAENGNQADAAEQVISRSGALDLDELREQWWSELRTGEREHYHREDRDFDRDEESYRRGFLAAQHPKRRGKAYADAEPDLKATHQDTQLDTAFRAGYERGQAHQSRYSESRES
jgi:hypothetical protein